MVILERIEGASAVLETDDGTLRIDAAELPAEAVEGDVLTGDGGKWVVDVEKTEERRIVMRNKLRRLIGNHND